MLLFMAKYWCGWCGVHPFLPYVHHWQLLSSNWFMCFYKFIHFIVNNMTMKLYRGGRAGGGLCPTAPSPTFCVTKNISHEQFWCYKINYSIEISWGLITDNDRSSVTWLESKLPGMVWPSDFLARTRHSPWASYIGQFRFFHKFKILTIHNSFTLLLPAQGSKPWADTYLFHKSFPP